jgi:hypothetical protein
MVHDGERQLLAEVPLAERPFVQEVSPTMKDVLVELPQDQLLEPVRIQGRDYVAKGVAERMIYVADEGGRATLGRDMSLWPVESGAPGPYLTGHPVLVPGVGSRVVAAGEISAHSVSAYTYRFFRAIESRQVIRRIDDQSGRFESRHMVGKSPYDLELLSRSMSEQSGGRVPFYGPDGYPTFIPDAPSFQPSAPGLYIEQPDEY